MILNHDTNICSATTKTTIASRNTCYVNSHLDMESSIAATKSAWFLALHYGLTGGWVQNFKGSYLLCFLHSALVFKARGQCDHHTFPLA